MQPQIKQQYKGKVISQNPTETHIALSNQNSNTLNQPTNYTIFFFHSFSPPSHLPNQDPKTYYIFTQPTLPPQFHHYKIEGHNNIFILYTNTYFCALSFLPWL